MKPFNSISFFNDDFFRELVTVAGVEYTAVFDRDQQADADGKLRPAAGMGELLFRVSDMARPAAHTEVVIGADTWTIQQVAQDGDCWRCAVKIKTRGAA